MKPLSKREKEIAHLLILGKESKEISTMLFISLHTIKCHRHSILKKTGCRNTTELCHSFFTNKINL